MKSSGFHHRAAELQMQMQFVYNVYEFIDI